MTSLCRGRALAESRPPVAPAPSPSTLATGPGVLERRRERAVQRTLDAVRFPLTRLVHSVADRLTRQPTRVGLATLEVEVRDAVLAMGRDLLTELVRLRGTGYRGHSYLCPCGARLTFKESTPLQQRTWFGTITLERAVYMGAGCQERAHHVPLDADWALLGVMPATPTPNLPAAAPLPTPNLPAAAPLPALPDPDGGALVAVAPGGGPARLAPAFARVVAELGTRLPYAEAAGVLEDVLGAVGHLSPTTIGTYATVAGQARAAQEDARRVRTQPPTRAERRAVLDQSPPPPPAAAPATLVISMDGALERTDDGWKEVKLGAIYDLVSRRRQGQVVHVPGATTYTATLAAAHDFGRQVLATAQRRGLGWAQQVAVLGDGAKWIWKLADRRFGGATQIVDWYHAHEHLWALAQLLYGEGTAAAWTWLATLADELWTAQTADTIAVVAAAAEEAWATPRKDLPDGTPRRTRARQREVAKAVAYFTTNASRMRYRTFRDAGLPVGSGVVEGGCQSVLHTRLKRPGACWSAAGAEAMVRARALLCSDPTPACSHPTDCLAS